MYGTVPRSRGGTPSIYFIGLAAVNFLFFFYWSNPSSSPSPARDSLSGSASSLKVNSTTPSLSSSSVNVRDTTQWGSIRHQLSSFRPFHGSSNDLHSSKYGKDSSGFHNVEGAVEDHGRALDSPTETCNFCVLNPKDPKCEYGLDNIKLSRAYEGSGHRVRKVLEKAMRGEVVEIGIIGASVTVGHGMPYGSVRWQDQFFNDFVTMFPNAKLHMGALSGMDSSFFSACFTAMLPTNLDMYLIELDINNPPYETTLGHDDALYRAILTLPQAPAVVRVGVFSIIFREMARGFPSSIVMSQWHDVPFLSIRNWILPHVMAHQETLPTFFGTENFGQVDYRHVGRPSHKAMGDMVALYIREQVCEIKRRRKHTLPFKPATGSVWPNGDVLGTVPSMHMWDSFFRQPPIPPSTPSCRLAGAEKNPLTPIRYFGLWSIYEWNGKTAWTSSVPGASSTFQFEGTKVGVYAWVTSGSHYPAGMVRCMVDNNPATTTYINVHMPDRGYSGLECILFNVADKLELVPHEITCEILKDSTSGGNEFRMVGIATL